MNVAKISIQGIRVSSQLLFTPSPRPEFQIANQMYMRVVRISPIWSFSSSCRLSHSRRCTSATLHASAKDELGWVHPDNQMEVIKVLDSAKRAAQRWSFVATDFLTPSVHADCITALKSRASDDDMGFVSFGGYPSAERARLVVGKRETLPDLGLRFAASKGQGEEEEAGSSNASAPNDPSPSELAAREDLITAIEIRGNFIFDPATHPDFLGAILGTGIQRGKIGDIIILGESGAQALIDPLMLEHLTDSLVRVRSVPVQVARIPLGSLKVRELKMEELHTVESSMRLDALASFGFKLSRTKMGELIKAGQVRVNWVEEDRVARELKEGDVVSCRGRGRVQVGEVLVTKKDRLRVNLKRFV